MLNASTYSRQTLVRLTGAARLIRLIIMINNHQDTHAHRIIIRVISFLSSPKSSSVLCEY